MIFSTQTEKTTVRVEDKDVVMKADRTFFCKLAFIAKTCDLGLMSMTMILVQCHGQLQCHWTHHSKWIMLSC